MYLIYTSIKKINPISRDQLLDALENNFPNLIFKIIKNKVYSRNKIISLKNKKSFIKIIETILLSSSKKIIFQQSVRRRKFLIHSYFLKKEKK